MKRVRIFVNITVNDLPANIRWIGALLKVKTWSPCIVARDVALDDSEWIAAGILFASKIERIRIEVVDVPDKPVI